MPPWFSSVRVGLLILVFLAIIPAVGLSLYHAGERRQHDGVAIQREALTYIRFLSAQHEQLIGETRQLLSFLARQPELRSGDPNVCSAYLAEIMKQYPFYTGVGVADLNGDVYCSSAPRPGPLNVADLPHFQGAQQNREYTIGRYHVGLLTGRGVLPFAYPLTDNEGILRSVILTTLDLAWLNQFIPYPPFSQRSSRANRRCYFTHYRY